nr:type 1 glutamine amidotransferase domain-containing protein [Scleromatobacter humisilvae]
MATVLVPLPRLDFDPTEAGVPWRVLTEAGHACVFATPDARPAQADPRMLEGRDLGLLAPMLRAQGNAVADHDGMAQSMAYRAPIAWGDIADGLAANRFDAVLLPGGHAPGMREYLESPLLQSAVATFFERDLPVAAICHGTVLAARSRVTRGDDAGRSVLFGRRTTGLTRQLEMLAWRLTRRRLGDYYRTYPQTVQDEVAAALRSPRDFLTGPPALLRDSDRLRRVGFTVRDGRYLSARWPGDAHRFAHELVEMLAAR